MGVGMFFPSLMCHVAGPSADPGVAFAGEEKKKGLTLWGYVGERERAVQRLPGVMIADRSNPGQRSSGEGAAPWRPVVAEAGDDAGAAT